MQNRIFIQLPSEGLVISRLVNSESIRQIFIEEASANYDYGVVLDTSCAGQLLYASFGSREEAKQAVRELLDILGIKVVACA